MLTKRPKQYTKTIDELKELLSKIKVKVEKGKGVRMRKKDKVRDKLQSGEYLPKEVYEIQRQAKLEVLSEKMKKEGKTLNLGKKTRDAKGNDKRKTFSKIKKDKEGRGNKFGGPSRDKFGGKEPRAFKGDRKGKETEGEAQGNYEKKAYEKKPFEKKPFKKFGDEDTRQPRENKWNDKSKEKRDFNSKVIDKKAKGDNKQPAKPKTLHPSWEAKNQQRAQETNIKFAQNEIFEFK